MRRCPHETRAADASRGLFRSAADIPPGLRCLLEAYPEALCSATETTLRWCDGAEMPYDDGRVKPDLETLLDSADLQDQMSQPYPAGAWPPVQPPVDFDPGRIRDEAFFRKMYGATEAEVRARLKPVRWLAGSVNVLLQASSTNGVDRALQAVSDELDRLPPELRKFAEKPAGTFVWRPIRGTGRPSLHSFGIAVDLDVAYADYWRWSRPGPDGRRPYRNRIPRQIVQIFERHGFIWGGRWHHHDTMHFEYRPELLAGPCRKDEP